MTISSNAIGSELEDISNQILACGWALQNTEKVENLKPEVSVDDILTDLKAIETAIDALREKLFLARIS